MSEPFDSTVLWNKLGSDAEVTTSEIGLPGVWGGSSTYHDAKFDKGSYSNAAANYVRFANVPSTAYFGNWQNTVISFWFKPEGYSIVAGRPDDALPHYFFSYYKDTNNRLRWGFDQAAVQLTFDAKIGGVWTIINGLSPNIADGVLTNFTIVINNAGIDGGADKFRLYINGVLFYSTTTIYTSWNTTTNLDLLVQTTVGTIVTPLNGTMDNIKINNDATVYQLILNNENNEGFPAAPDIGIPIPSKTLRERAEKIIVAGIDIHELGLTVNFPDFTYYKTFDKDLSIINTLSIPVINKDGFFSLDNPASPFNKTNWKGEEVKSIDRDSITIWEGILANIKRNHEGDNFSLDSKSNLYLDRYTYIDYDSDVDASGWEDGATAFENICTKYGITNLNQKNLKISQDYLQANNCLMKVVVALTDKKNMMAVLEEIAVHSSADFYFFKGEIFFQVWRPNTLLSINIELAEDDLLSSPDITIPDKYIVNEYAINYSGMPAGTPATADIGSLSRTKFGTRDLSNVSGDGIVTFQDLTSARFIGNQQIYRRHKNFDTNPDTLQLIKFDVSLDLREYFTLDTFFRMNFSPEAWVDKSFEVFKLHYRYSQNVLGIEAFEVAS